MSFGPFSSNPIIISTLPKFSIVKSNCSLVIESESISRVISNVDIPLLEIKQVLVDVKHSSISFCSLNGACTTIFETDLANSSSPNISMTSSRYVASGVS